MPHHYPSPSMWLAPRHSRDSLVWRLALLQKRSPVTFEAPAFMGHGSESCISSVCSLLMTCMQEAGWGMWLHLGSQIARKTSGEQCELGVRGSLECTIRPLCEFLQGRRGALSTMPTLCGLDQHLRSHSTDLQTPRFTHNIPTHYLNKPNDGQLHFYYKFIVQENVLFALGFEFNLPCC